MESLPIQEVVQVTNRQAQVTNRQAQVIQSQAQVVTSRLTAPPRTLLPRRTLTTTQLPRGRLRLCMFIIDQQITTIKLATTLQLPC